MDDLPTRWLFRLLRQSAAGTQGPSEVRGHKGYGVLAEHSVPVPILITNPDVAQTSLASICVRKWKEVNQWRRGMCTGAMCSSDDSAFPPVRPCL